MSRQPGTGSGLEPKRREPISAQYIITKRLPHPDEPFGSLNLKEENTGQEGAILKQHQTTQPEAKTKTPTSQAPGGVSTYTFRPKREHQPPRHTTINRGSDA